MKILFLAPQPFFVERGTPIAVRYAVEALSRAGHHVDLITFHGGTDVAIPGVRHIRTGPRWVGTVPIGFSWRKLVCDLWLLATAWRLLLTGRHDVVHAVEEAPFLMLPLRLVRRFHLVWDMDSLMSDQISEKWPRARILRPLLAALERWAARRVDLLLPVCEAIAAPFRRAAPAVPLHLLPDVAPAIASSASSAGVDDLRALFGIKGPMALYVGNLEHYQGVGMLVDALALLPEERRPALAVVGGAADDIEMLREKAHASGLAGWVHFAGPRPLSHLPWYLGQADILCSPRLKGVNTPMKIYAYMASGRAILATRIVSHTQVLDDHMALLADPRPDLIAEGLERLAADAALRARLGNKAAEQATANYSEDTFAARLGAAYAIFGPRQEHRCAAPVLEGQHG